MKISKVQFFTTVMTVCLLQACQQGKVCPPTHPVSEVKKGTNDVLATVKGQNITDSELRANPEIKMKLYQAELNIYNAAKAEHDQLKESLDTYIQNKLLSDAAKAKNITVEEYIKAEVDDKIPPATEAEIKKFYEERKINRPLDGIKDKIAEFLKNQKSQEVRKTYFEKLMKENQVVVSMADFNQTKPLPPKLEIAYDQNLDPMKGPKSAKVTIVSFSDYQCPYCKKSEETVNEVLKKFGKQVNYVFRHYPLPFHKDAKPAAIAAACAHDQKKFWQFHDVLFENQQALKEADLVNYAKKAKLNEKIFSDCLNSKKFEQKVDKDLEEGKKYGVTGTPAFFINGRMLSGARGVEDFEELINMELYAMQQAKS